MATRDGPVAKIACGAVRAAVMWLTAWPSSADGATPGLMARKPG